MRAKLLACGQSNACEEAEQGLLHGVCASDLVVSSVPEAENRERAPWSRPEALDKWRREAWACDRVRGTVPEPHC